MWLGERGVEKDSKEFLQAYHQFKESVDFGRAGFLPQLETLVCYMLMGIPYVPADEDPSETAQIEAIDQRVNNLKAVFVELNKDESDTFLDNGLTIYDQAGKIAKDLLSETG